MADSNKVIEIMKAAMEKEKAMMEKSKETAEKQIDGEEFQIFDNEVLENEELQDALKEEILNDGNELETTEVVDNTENSETKPEKASRSFFKNNKAKELSAKDQKIEELTDRLMRTVAEFDNFRKRSDKEKSMMYDMGVKSIIEKILPIVDNFERGFGTITEKEKEGAFAQGIELIYKQLISALDEIGLKPIDAVGKEFDPNLHNAVMHGEDENTGENIVSDEFQKGYLYRDMVVRHSMVKVVN
ncbi:MAG: nucleotide exchange factor GrpE [Herbinix sp.]|nr:nucleotide exchange factor GrpE [Herbinix sp.]